MPIKPIIQCKTRYYSSRKPRLRDSIKYFYAWRVIQAISKAKAHTVLFAELLARSECASGTPCDQPSRHTFPWLYSVFKQMLRWCPSSELLLLAGLNSSEPNYLRWSPPPRPSKFRCHEDGGSIILRNVGIVIHGVTEQVGLTAVIYFGTRVLGSNLCSNADDSAWVISWFSSVSPPYAGIVPRLGHDQPFPKPT
jgi:hypothetical protein